MQDPTGLEEWLSLFSLEEERKVFSVEEVLVPFEIGWWCLKCYVSLPHYKPLDDMSSDGGELFTSTKLLSCGLMHFFFTN